MSLHVQHLKLFLQMLHKSLGFQVHFKKQLTKYTVLFNHVVQDNIDQTDFSQQFTF